MKGIMTYHIRRKDREITDKSELFGIIAQNKYASLALCSENEPYIVTLTYGYNKNSEAMYFHSNKDGLKIDFIKRNPNVCLTIIEDFGFDSETCNHPFKSLIIRGKLEFIEDKSEVDAAIKLMIPDSVSKI
jgi:uncharacterized protein